MQSGSGCWRGKNRFEQWVYPLGFHLELSKQQHTGKVCMRTSEPPLDSMKRMISDYLRVVEANFGVVFELDDKYTESSITVHDGRRWLGEIQMSEIVKEREEVCS